MRMTRSASLASRCRALLGLCRRFRRGQAGVAMVEFAFVAPIMLTIYFGVVEVGQAVMIDRKVTQLNRALADLAAQSTSIDDAYRDNVFNAALSVMQPYTAVAPAMTFASIVIDDKGVAKICWSEGKNATPPTKGSTVTVPVDLRVPSTSLIVARASYSFTPTIGYVVTGSIKLGGVDIYMRPRVGKAGGTKSIEQVERSGTAMCP